MTVMSIVAMTVLGGGSDDGVNAAEDEGGDGDNNTQVYFAATALQKFS